MKRWHLGWLLLCAGFAWSQEIPEPIPIQDSGWRCVAEDGPTMSHHTTLVQAIHGCQEAAAASPGVTFLVMSALYSVQGSGEVVPPPEPDPCPFDPPGPSVPIDDPSCVEPPPPEPEPDPCPFDPPGPSVPIDDPSCVEPPPPDDDTSHTRPFESPLRTLGPASAMTVFPDENSFSQGTFRWELEFTLDAIGGTQGLVSRDQSGQAEAGHTSAWMDGNKLIVRHQDIEGGHVSARLESTTVFQINQKYIVTISIGPTGTALFVGSQLEDFDTWSIGTLGNTLDLVLGGLCTRCTADGSVGPSRPIFGTVTLRIYNSEADWTPPPPVVGNITLQWQYPIEWTDNTPLAMEDIDFINVYSCAGSFLNTVDPPATTHVYVDQPAGDYCFYLTASATNAEGQQLESSPSNQGTKTIE